MVRFLNRVGLWLAMGMVLGAQDKPRVFVAPVTGGGGLSFSEVSPLAGQFRQILRDETRYQVVEQEAKKASTGLFGAMSDIGIQDEGESGKAENALKVARLLHADGVLATAITRKPLAGYGIVVQYLDATSGAVKARYQLVSGPAFGDIAGALTTVARRLDDRLPPPPKARAPFPTFKIPPKIATNARSESPALPVK